MSVAETLKAEARLEVARKMIQKGIELTIVWRVTGLTEEELKANGIIK
ncbi:hypothetical protein ACE5IS_13950 [Leptospira wolffii]|uniref:Uncharacterized protein n=1 Tax=Leptospira wolffii TaxID=409998 RepID=A0ABV5BQB8_9LEPT|nr:hypothetical protein [Leptospira wolffii]EPG65761.1 hypothetical protein LEP1GSC061_0041 [Leptospira wolffii serovar Khorat str. Khorat-H2]